MMRAMYGLGILLFIFLPSVDGGDAAARARAALALADAKPKLTYAEGCKRAMAEGVDLWVYVGIPSKPNDAAIVCEAASLEGYPAKCIVVAQPGRDGMYWSMTLDEHGKEVRPVVAAPFRPVFAVQSTLDCTSGG